MKRLFSRKSVFDMSENERYFDSFAHKLSVKYIFKTIKKATAVKYYNGKQFIIFSPSVYDNSKYRITYIDDNGPVMHENYNNLMIVAKNLYSAINYNLNYIEPIETK